MEAKSQPRLVSTAIDDAVCSVNSRRTSAPSFRKADPVGTYYQYGQLQQPIAHTFDVQCRSCVSTGQYLTGLVSGQALMVYLVIS